MKRGEPQCVGSEKTLVIGEITYLDGMCTYVHMGTYLLCITVPRVTI